MRASRLLALLPLLALFAAGPAYAGDPRQVVVGFTPLVSGLHDPVVVKHAYDGTGRLFVVERAGRIRIVKGGRLLARPFLDISSRTTTSGERGLLGLAFNESYRYTGDFWVFYTNTSGNIQVSRFHGTPGADTASSASEYRILSIAHPGATNHNGGEIAFGPARYFYIGTGDGGGAGDPNGNAQNRTSLLGKILRIDVLHTQGSRHYAIPSSNPYAGSKTLRNEIWTVGLRNPWRYSFDTSTSALYIGDVGQDDREEVDVLGKGVGGKNLGWDCREGYLNTASRYGGSYCSGPTFSPPLYQYDHSLGCAIIGGHVYRGSAYSSLLGGVYVYGDYCSSRVWGLVVSGGHTVNAQMGTAPTQILCFGRSQQGELFLGGANGTVYRLTARHR